MKTPCVSWFIFSMATILYCSRVPASGLPSQTPRCSMVVWLSVRLLSSDVGLFDVDWWCTLLLIRIVSFSVTCFQFRSQVCRSHVAVALAKFIIRSIANYLAFLVLLSFLIFVQMCLSLSAVVPMMLALPLLAARFFFVQMPSRSLIGS